MERMVQDMERDCFCPCVRVCGKLGKANHGSNDMMILSVVV